MTPISTEPDMPTHRSSQLARTTSLLALAALASVACNDSTSPIPPATASAATAAVAAKPARAPYISDFTLHYIDIDMAPDGTYDNGYELTMSNPGQKTDGVSFQVELQQGQYTQDGGGNSVYCAGSAGILPHGTCRMTWWVSRPTYPLVTGPAHLTIRLLQVRVDGTFAVLDSRTVDVEIVHS